jgi:hypothetical protein
MIHRPLALLTALLAALAGCGDDAAGSGGAGGKNLGGVGGAGGGPVERGPCAWPGEDPGNLVATGKAPGDVIANVSGLVDQCGVTRSLWDFAGRYRIVVLAEGW